MTLKEALSHFKNLRSETRNKSRMKVYQEFIQIVSSLEKRNLSESEIESIEKELDALELNSVDPNNTRLFNQALKHFKKYLKDTLSLTPKGYYTNLGIGLGSSFGVLAGIVLISGFERSLGISLGISFGLLMGVIIGRSMDIKAEDSGKVY